MHKRRHRKETPLLEALEPRQLLSAAISFSSRAPARFVVDDNSITLIGTLPNIQANLPGEDVDGPGLHATVEWGDGTSSDATLHRDAKGRIQVWAGHAYDMVKTYKLTVLTDTGSTPKIAFKNSAIVSLNAARGRTISARSGQPFSGLVATVERTAGLPIFTVPQASIDLPPGSHFCQYTVGDQPATALVRIDWGDGAVSDGTFVSKGGNYNVSGTHTYASAGAYRVIVNVIIEAADHSVLHIDMINSTARVDGTPVLAISPPPHSQVDFTTLLPQGTTLTLTNPGTSNSSGGVNSFNSVTFSSGTSAGVLTLNAGHLTIPTGATTLVGNGLLGSGVGTLHLTGGTLTYLPNLNLGGGTLVLGHGGGSFNGGAGSVSLGPGGTVIPITNNTGSGIIVINPVSNPVIASGLDLGAGVVATYNSAGAFLKAYLSDPAGDRLTELSLNAKSFPIGGGGGTTTNFGQNTVSLNLTGGTLPTFGSGILILNSSANSLSPSNIVFNLNSTPNQILSFLNILAPSYSGVIVLPPAAAGLSLPVLSSARILIGTTVPAGTTLYLVDADGNVTLTTSIPA